MNQRKTIKEWREMRGMSIDELSGKTGFPPEQIRRWEEIGFDAYPNTRRGDILSNEALRELFLVLGVEEEGISGPDYAPSTPIPGSLSLDPNLDVPEVNTLLQYAQELDLGLRFLLSGGQYSSRFETYLRKSNRLLKTTVERRPNTTQLRGTD